MTFTNNGRLNEINIYATAHLEMYENVDSRPILSGSTEEFVIIDSSTDAGGMEFFTKNNFIVLQCATQNNTFADGATQNIGIYTYDGYKFVSKLNERFSGSMHFVENNDPVNKVFKEIGFNLSADYWSENSVINPYFIGSDIYDFDGLLNLAKIEDDIDLISELFITNNYEDLSIDYMQDMDKIWEDLIDTEK